MYIYVLAALHLLRCDCLRGIALTSPRVLFCLVLYVMCLGLHRQVLPNKLLLIIIICHIAGCMYDMVQMLMDGG